MLRTAAGDPPPASTDADMEPENSNIEVGASRGETV